MIERRQRKESIEDDDKERKLLLMREDGSTEIVENTIENGIVTRQVYRYKDQLPEAWTPSGFVEMKSALNFYEFLKRIDVPRLEFAATKNDFPFYSDLSAEDTIREDTIRRETQVQKPEMKQKKSVRKFPDGTTVLVSEFLNYRGQNYYSPDRICSVKTLIFKTSDGKEKMVFKKEVEFDDYDLVDRPVKIAAERILDNVTDFKSGDKVVETIEDSVDIRWIQFNEEKLDWPDFTNPANAEKEFNQLLIGPWESN
jgi:hypothetical protein